MVMVKSFILLILFGLEWCCCNGMCWKAKRVASLSVVLLNQINRSISSSTLVSSQNHGELMRLVNVESLKMKLGMEVKEVIAYSELLQACESMGVARNQEEAATFARVLDEAGVILLFGG